MSRTTIIVLALALLGRMAAAQVEAKLEFDVASVKPGKPGGTPNSNFPLGPGDAYTPNGSFFSATSFSLISYIAFAYKLLGNDAQYLMRQAPGWLMTDRFDIQARASGSPTKDQMRIMLQSLLADRFKLVVHYETRQVPVFALVLVKPGKTGPQFRPHPDDSSCSTIAPAPSDPASSAAYQQTVDAGFPSLCGGIFGTRASAAGRLRQGARNIPLELIANWMSTVGDLGRPVIDLTGLSGTFDFSMEWTPEIKAPLPPGVDFQPDPSGPTFREAMNEQLGLKLASQDSPITILVVDHAEHPSEN